MMNFFIIDNIETFKSRKAGWDRISAVNAEFFPFQCHEWYEVWLKHFLGKSRLAIVEGYLGSDLKVIAPLYFTTCRVRGVSIKKIELIGNAYSPIRNVVFGKCTDEEKETLTVEIIKKIKEFTWDWDVLDLSCLPEESRSYATIISAVKQSKLPCNEYICYADWYQDSINVCWDEYLSHIPVSIRKDISYCRRRLERDGSVSFSLIKAHDGIDEYIDQYYSVYSKSWQKQEVLGPHFHRDLAIMAAENGSLRLGFLLFKETPIASQFWIVADGTAYILKTVYDQQFKKFSVGKLLTAEMMKSAIDIDKVTAIDYVQGDEEYKKQWTPKRRERRGVYIYNSTIKGRGLSLAQKTILPFMRKHINYINQHKQIKNNIKVKDVMNYKVITSIKDIATLKDKWNELASMHKNYELFMSYEWHNLWLNKFEENNKIHIIAIFNNERLVAIAPLTSRKIKIKNLSVTKLELLGNAYSPFRSLIIDPMENMKTVSEALSSAINTFKSEWDILQIGPLYEGCGYSDAETIIKHLGCRYVRRNIDVNWRIQKQYDSFDAYLTSRKTKFRQEIKRRVRKLNEIGSVEISIRDNQEAEKLFKDYDRVYQKSWKRVEGIGPGFHSELATIASKKKQLLIAILYLDGEPIAAQYRIICGNICFFLKTAYDADYRKYSPGLILLYEDIKYLIDDKKILIIDFGPGNEMYKSEWADTMKNYTEYIVFNNTMSGALIHRGFTTILPLISKVQSIFNKSKRPGIVNED